MRWLILAAVGVMAGCGPDCLSTCQHLHGDGVDADGTAQCNIQVPGQPSTDLIRECAASCEYAMARAGDLEGYDPNVRVPPSQSKALKNDKQAAAWMDCVRQESCEDLKDYYCAPTSNYSQK